MRPPSTSPGGRVASAVAGTLLGLPGALLGAAAGAAAVVRHARALHPGGRAGVGTLVIDGNAQLPAPFDAVAEHAALLRFSWAAGTGPQRPDIHGLAIRLTDAATGPVDWLFASTGRAVGARLVPTIHPPGSFGFLSTLLPMRSTAGPLVLGLQPAVTTTGDPTRLPTEWTLLTAGLTDPWLPAGRLNARWTDGDTERRSDGLRHPHPDLPPYGWVTAVREPAYAVSRALFR